MMRIFVEDDVLRGRAERTRADRPARHDGVWAAQRSLIKACYIRIAAETAGHLVGGADHIDLELDRARRALDVAHPAQQLVEPLERLGELVGEAFQLRDDLLGTFGDPAITGKPIDSDIREGKKNVLYAKTLAALADDDLGVFETRWGGGDSLSDDECVRLRSLVESSGAKAETEALLARLTEEAVAVLAGLPVTDEVRAGLHSLVEAATSRQS